MEYALFSLREPNWRKATLQQGQEFLSRLLALMPERIEHLASVTDISWVYSRSGIDELQRPLRRFCSWVDGLPTVEYLPRAGDRATVEVLNPAVADVLMAIEMEHREKPDYDMTKVGVSVARDLSILLGEFLRVRYPWLFWGIENDQRAFDFAMPCLSGGNPKGYQRMPTFLVASTLVLRAGESGKGLLPELKAILPVWVCEMSVPPDAPSARGGTRRAKIGPVRSKAGRRRGG